MAGKNISRLALAMSVIALFSCTQNTYYDASQIGSGIFSGGNSYRLKHQDPAYRPVASQQVSRNTLYYPPTGDLPW